MRIQEVELFHFRNHHHTKVTWAPHINVIIGPNGAGKTSVIDAIHYLCMSRSFVTSSDTHVVKQDTKSFLLKGRFLGQIRAEFELSLSYSRGEGKKIFVNEGPLEKLSDLIGMVPVVVLSPQDQELTKGGPVERRAFIDAFISQLSNRYLRDLLEYRQIRRQRNKLLQQYAEGGSYRLDKNTMLSYLEPWNEQMIRVGSRIINKRAQLVEQLQEVIGPIFKNISGLNLHTRLEYDALVAINPHSAEQERMDFIEAAYRKSLQENFERELERGQSLVGPHRDEIVFYLEEVELRRYGSQGQHRLFALALKLAQLAMYTNELEDAPLLMLDDVFGDLDGKRVRKLLEHLKSHQGQTFITAAHPISFGDYVDFSSNDHLRLTIESGTIKEDTTS